MFKLTKAGMAAAGIISCFAHSAMAADNATLNVKGTITPAACSIDITGSADYGTIKAGDLTAAGLESGGYQLGTKRVPYKVSCDTAVRTSVTPIADNLTDNTSIGVKFDSQFITASELKASLGTVDGNDIGYYAVAMSVNALKPSSPNDMLYMTEANVGSDSFGISPVGIFNLIGAKHYTPYGNLDNPHQIFSEYSGEIFVNAVINPDVLKSLTDAITFDTNTTFTLNYL